ncbi:hypothetical protein [Exiguobacterium antarcticum]|nr:hypothetical protein [Exiguobacterium antarcticum]
MSSNARKLNKQVLEYCNLKKYSITERFNIFIHYKKELLKFNQTYTMEFNYIKSNSSDILRCEYLTETQIRQELILDYKNHVGNFNDKNIQRKARKRIKESLYTLYVIESALLYFREHQNKAHRTIKRFEQDSLDGSEYHKLYPKLFLDRKIKLTKIIIQIDKIHNILSKEKYQIEYIISELEKCKNPTLWNIIGKVITAPVRHPVNFVTAVFNGDVKGSFTHGTRTALMLFGVGIVGDTFDVFEAVFDGIDIEGVDRALHHVDSHWVEGYTKQDGTIVDGYYRGGEGGYFRS